MRRLLPIFLLLSACATAPYRVQQSVTVPGPALAPLPAPRGKQLDFAAGYSLTTGQQAEDAPGTFVARHQLDVVGQVRLTPGTSVRALYFHGPRAGARSAGVSLVDRPSGGVNGVGAGVAQTFAPATWLEWGGFLDVVVLLASSRVASCEQPCAEASTPLVEEKLALGSLVTLGGMARWSVHRNVHLVFALAVRNQPTSDTSNERNHTDALLTPGPLLLTSQAGVDVDVREGLRVSASGQFPLVSGAFGFGPVVSIALRGGFDLIGPQRPLTLPSLEEAKR